MAEPSRKSLLEEGLPGTELVGPGLEDLALGRVTVEALLVAIAAPRLRALGLPLPEDSALPGSPELALYQLLREESGPDPYRQYKALLARLGAFGRAADHIRRRGV